MRRAAMKPLSLVENFNPLSSAELGGTRLIYEPLEIPSTIDGTYTPFLATWYKFTDHDG
jgi:peptide/nickel transport system substrate-binding protein